MWCRIASDASSRPDDLRRIINGPLFKYEKKNKIEVASVPKAEEYRAVLQLFPHLVVDEPAVYAVWVALQDFYAKAHEGSFTTKSMIELDAAALRWIAPLSVPVRFVCHARVHLYCSSELDLRAAGCKRRSRNRR